MAERRHPDRKVGDGEFKLLGKGIYTPAEAARLTRIPASTILRWLRGYHYRLGSRDRELPPIINHSPAIPGLLVLTFADLIEVQFVNGFRGLGVPWKTIRLASERASTIAGSAHPFSTRAFKALGKKIVAELASETKDKRLLELTQSQFLLPQIVAPNLREALEYGTGDRLLRWWPVGRRNEVVLDPARRMGQPIVNTAGVPTATLATAYKVEQSFNRVAELYEVNKRAVREAVEFERGLSAA